MIDASYRTLADQPHRAMAGLSMGGMQTRVITLASPDTFSHVGMFSGGSISPEDVAGAPGVQGEGQAPVRQLRQPRAREPRSPGRPSFGGDPKVNTAALKAAGINDPLLRLARHRPRVADLAAQPVPVRPTRVQKLRPPGAAWAGGLLRAQAGTPPGPPGEKRPPASPCAR